jgi:urea transporter
MPSSIDYGLSTTDQIATLGLQTPHMIKSIWAVLAGMLVNVILSITTDTILEMLGIISLPSEGLFITWMVITVFAYRLVYTYLGGLVTARLAPDRAMRHVIILGCIGTALSVAGIYFGWNLSPHWYPIALAVTAFPVTWWGGVRGAIKMQKDNQDGWVRSSTKGFKQQRTK